MKKIFTLAFLFFLAKSTTVNAQGIYQLFGATGYGGPEDRGTIFTTKYDGTGHSIKKLFTVENSGAANFHNKAVVYNGKLYSALNRGGLHDYGIISEFDPATGIYKKMADLFSIGEEGTASGMIVYNNKLYGTTHSNSPGIDGAIFEFNPLNGSLVKRHQFESPTGHSSLGDLTLFNNKLFGITASGGANSNGAIFEFDPATNVYAKKKDLTENINGSSTHGSFIIYNNKLWAVSTYSDGPLKGGYIFSYDPATNTISPKIELGSISADFHTGALALLNNKMYGVANDKLMADGSVLFQYDPALNVLTREKVLTEAMGFGGTTMQTHGNLLYGTSGAGNANGNGVIFSYDPAINLYSTKVVFSAALGGSPSGALTIFNNKLYGFTTSGVYGITGVLFEYNPAANSYSKKIELGGNDIIRPNGRMTLYNNKLFGVGAGGGNSSHGGIFSFDPTTFTYEERYKMQGLDGNMSEQGGLTLFNNKFYGVSHWGGINDQGVLFTFDPATNAFTKLFDFGGANGERPTGLLLEYSGKLYGTCSKGGGSDKGTIFEYNPVTNQVLVKVVFDGIRGAHPNSGLILYNGKVYGSAAGGGINNNGTLFEYLPQANGLIKLTDFEANSTGYSPYGGLVAHNSKLYGFTAYGNTDHYSGKLYEFDITSNILSIKVNLSSAIGRHGIARMNVVGNKLVGMTNIGGDYIFGGVLFEYDPVTNNFTTRKEFTIANGRLPRNNELTKLPAPAAPGSPNSCSNANFTSINAANANEWLAFTDVEGRAVAEINANGNILGNVQVRFFINDGALRQHDGTFYADRNITITTQFTPATPVTVRLYLKNAEFLKMRNTPGSGVVLPPDISVFKNNDFCAADINGNATMMPTTNTVWGLDHVYTTEVISFSSFYFASTSKVLPVSLLSFTGKTAAITNTLSWKATCTGNTSFYIERSTDGISYTNIGKVDASEGDCNLPFEFNDAIPPAKAFYRLRIIENNTADKYSSIIVLTRAGNAALLVDVMPNPVSGSQAMIRITSASSRNAQLRLMDVNGRILLISKARLQPGINNILLNVASLSSGLYYVQYSDAENKNKMIKLVKK